MSSGRSVVNALSVDVDVLSVVRTVVVGMTISWRSKMCCWTTARWWCKGCPPPPSSLLCNNSLSGIESGKLLCCQLYAVWCFYRYVIGCFANNLLQERRVAICSLATSCVVNCLLISVVLAWCLLFWQWFAARQKPSDDARGVPPHYCCVTIPCLAFFEETQPIFHWPTVGQRKLYSWPFMLQMYFGRTNYYISECRSTTTLFI